jgi:hypothetical protein
MGVDSTAALDAYACGTLWALVSGEAAVLDMRQLVVEAFEGGTSRSG